MDPWIVQLFGFNVFREKRFASSFHPTARCISKLAFKQLPQSRLPRNLIDKEFRQTLTCRNVSSLQRSPPRSSELFVLSVAGCSIWRLRKGGLATRGQKPLDEGNPRGTFIETLFQDERFGGGLFSQSRALRSFPFPPSLSLSLSLSSSTCITSRMLLKYISSIFFHCFLSILRLLAAHAFYLSVQQISYHESRYVSLFILICIKTMTSRIFFIPVGRF